jgi:hypothetical protein
MAFLLVLGMAGEGEMGDRVIWFRFFFLTGMWRRNGI